MPQQRDWFSSVLSAPVSSPPQQEDDWFGSVLNSRPDRQPIAPPRSKAKQAWDALNVAPKFITDKTRVNKDSTIVDDAGGYWNSIKQIPGAIRDIASNAWERPSSVGSMTGGFARGAIEGAGELASPINLADAATGFGKGSVIRNLNRGVSAVTALGGAQDISEGNLLAGIPEVAFGALGMRGSKPKINVVPQVEPPTPPPPIAPPVTPITNPARLLQARNPVPERQFISHPSGKLADSFNADTPEALRSLDLQRPGTTLRDIDIRPDQYTHIPPKVDEPWDFESLGKKPVKEPWNLPRSRGVQSISPGDEGGLPRGEVSGRKEIPIGYKEIKVKYRDPVTKRLKTKTELVPLDVSPEIESAIKHKKIEGKVKSGDYLDSDPLYGTVPNRLRPEAPNVTRLRDMSEGYGKQGAPYPVEPVVGVSGPRGNWGGPAKTVEIGEGATGRPKNSKLNYEPNPLQHKVEEIDEAAIKQLNKNNAARGITPSAPPRDSILAKRRMEQSAPKVDTSVVPEMDMPEQRPRSLDPDENIDDVIIPPGLKNSAFPPQQVPSVREIVRDQNVGFAEARQIRDDMLNAKPRKTTDPVPTKGVKPPERLRDRLYDSVFNDKFVNRNPVFKRTMESLIKVRSADQLIGKGIKNQFKHIAGFTKDPDSIVDFQNRLKAGEFPEVRKFFDDLHQRMTGKGIDVGYKDNYLPQMWEDSAEDVGKVFSNKELNKKASFQHQSFFDDYQKGIDAKLTPKYSPLELMEYYGKRANKLEADNKAIGELINNGYLKSRSQKTASMEPIDPRLLTFGRFYAEPQVKSVLENYLLSSEQKSKFLSTVAHGVGKSSNVVLSSGAVPNKPVFTAQGLNVAMPFQGRSYQEGGWKRTKQAWKYGTNPKAAREMLMAENDAIIDATKKHGFNMNVGDAESAGPKFFEDETGKYGTGKAKKGFNWLTEKQNKYFEKPLFEDMIPAVKWEAWKEQYAKALKSGVGEEEAGRIATQVSDDFYGGKNLDLLYNNKNFNAAMRILFIAPDWMRSTLSLGKRIPSSFNAWNRMSDAERTPYVKAGGKLLATYTVANLIHKQVNGKYMAENDDPFQFDLGKDSEGKPRSFKLFGGSADAFKVAMRAAKQSPDMGGIAERLQFYENRASPLSQLGMNIYNGADWKGETNIAAWGGKDKFGNKVPLSKRLENTFSQGVNMLPPHVSSLYNIGTGRMSPEEAAARVAELPLKYQKPKKKAPFLFQPKEGGFKPYDPTTRRR